MPGQDLKTLLDNYLAGKLSAEELSTLMASLDLPENEAVWKTWMDSLWDNTDLHQGADQAAKKRVLASIFNDRLAASGNKPFIDLSQSDTDSGAVVSIRRKTPLIRFTVAAAVLLLILGGAYLWNQSLKEQTPVPVAIHNQDIAPGGNKAILTLANGKRIMLDSSQGQIIAAGNLRVVNTKGQLDYAGQANAIETHTLSTPLGGQYRLMLPDGTQVWLNSLSSISYPTAFDGARRSVTITGEAYFEVAKNKQKPFIVHTRKQDIEVLGTHFNVNSYSDEPDVKTTLTEGKVTIRGDQGTLVLAPGQQSVVDKSGNVSLVTDPNVEEILAWKNGLFYFNAADIKTIMNQVARWYEVRIIYQDEIEEEFVAEISRDVPVSKLLQLLQLTNHVHFNIENNTITVMK